MIFLKRILFANFFLCCVMFGMHGMIVSDSSDCCSYKQESRDDRKRAIEIKIKEYMAEKNWHGPEYIQGETDCIFYMTLCVARSNYECILYLNEVSNDAQIVELMKYVDVTLNDVAMVAPQDIEKACLFYHMAQCEK